MLRKCVEIWDEVRLKTPLVQCITNYVTINDVANIVLASGASPAMVENPKEAGDFARISSALYLNLGTLTGEQELAMLEAVKGASFAGVPVIVDPVACGVIPRKVEMLERLIENSKIACIKGNSAEIKSLAGVEASARGVDSLDQGEGLEQACQALAKKEQTVVAATGAVDVVADYQRLAFIKNGTFLYASITGAGCMVGGVVAACIGIAPQEPWLATITGLIAFNIAGERTARVSGENPGSFRSLLFDNLYHMRGEDILKEAQVEWRS
ncbi:MAG: hydroxyethylthiazole kinase [Firmicutes bacterium HGW-Firmicutes-15]|nr:MAG: hydroxyethylthiazole kinase [Firmicutes bacterium HGW-Firmicutes-15]